MDKYLALGALLLLTSTSALADEFNISRGFGMHNRQGSPDVQIKVSELTYAKEIKPWLLLGGSAQFLESTIIGSGHYIDEEWYEGTNKGLTFNGRLILRKQLGPFALDLFGGLGLLTPATLPEIGSSGFVGHFGGSIGLNIVGFQLGFGAEHTSDPLTSRDKGWNYYLLTIGKRF